MKETMNSYNQDPGLRSKLRFNLWNASYTHHCRAKV